MITEPALESSIELRKGYEHREVESRWYQMWKERGYFHADEGDSARPPFSIVLPPPNVTGSLHLGHALTATLQDILVRYKRMSGWNALWLPGTDHAGIATQMIVEKELERTEHKSRHDLGRTEFLKRVWAFKEKFGSRIGEQHEALGASLDWERERFTMDEGLTRAVREVFVRLYEEGLIYRAERLINWCPRCRTALSDLEVSYEDGHQGELWSFAYPLAPGTPGEAAASEIVVATTRPETMLGDTAVAVHPDDERYRSLIGRKVVHPLLDRELPVVADAILVDPKFGTGAVKVTPAHDFNDFEAGRRHDLETISVIDESGKMNANAGPVAGLDRFEARKKVKELIAAKGLHRGDKTHVLPLGRCQRCETILEPLLSRQWFVRIEPLAGPAIRAVEEGRTRFVPEQWKSTYMSWMRNIHDWCISRQLWWGHQIPAWYCQSGHATVALEAPATCATCGGGELRQDDDVLDTWFSSGLWPFSTMGWPEKTKTLETFYPTSVMETGHDIIFFWVARMMMMGLHFMGEVPFRVVYLHPMVRDEKGQKMSKTKGNVIDPLVITEEYGADALRFTLAALTAQGRDIKLAKERIDGYRAFANKLWNATRFALMNLAGFTAASGDISALARSPADRWILARLQRAVNETLEALDGYRFNDAASTIYQFVWHELCDWYIELAKESLHGNDRTRKEGAQAVLTHALETSLRLLHPLMPFITEELWQTLKKQVGGQWGDSIMVASYPEKGAPDEAAERSFGPVIGIVDALRNIRGEMNIPFKVALKDVKVGALSDEALATVVEETARVVRLAHVEGFAASSDPTGKIPGSAVAIGSGFELCVPLAGVVNVSAETARIEKELAKVELELSGVDKKLANESFLARAPREIVEKDRARAGELREKRERLASHRQMLAEAAMASESAPEDDAGKPLPQEEPMKGSASARPRTAKRKASKVTKVRRGGARMKKAGEPAKRKAKGRSKALAKKAPRGSLRPQGRAAVSVARKTPAKKIPAKVPAKKVPVKKVPAKKVPAKKVPTKKAPVKKVPTKKGSARRSAPPASKRPRSRK